jgi:hypothetical protein
VTKRASNHFSCFGIRSVGGDWGQCVFFSIFGWISGGHPDEYNLAKFQNMNVERSYLAPFHVVGNYIYTYRHYIFQKNREFVNKIFLFQNGENSF